MGFISYSLDFYSKELREIESCAATEAKIYRAKQLLKMLDDLVDEGYTELSEKLEAEQNGVSRLRNYLKDNNAEPFKLYGKLMKASDVTYERSDSELTASIDAVIEKAKSSEKSENAFLCELVRFCEWIGYEEDTAYIFLLRDTLLPYVYYKANDRHRIYPWLLGRKALTMLSGRSGVDDDIRASVIKALELGQCRDFGAFCDFVIPDIRKSLDRYPTVKSCLTELLGGITEKKIITVESGCSGTFPMLLMSFDDRVDVRMYTTYPYLSDVYGERIFTSKYEENRLFETMYSQDLYFRLSGVRDGRFYVNKCRNSDVIEKALAEIKAMIG